MAVVDWSVAACLERAAVYLKRWPGEESPVLVHAALELRMAMELYLLSRIEEITGERPITDGREPLDLLDEALQLHDEAMTPQTWSVGIAEDLRENPVTAPRMGYAVLTTRKARTFYTQLTDLLHGTAPHQAGHAQTAFWDKQYATLVQIHADLSEICLGTGGASRVGPLPETGSQGAVL